LAQRTTQNVTTQSNDAFGRSVGNDRSGLYSSDEVRGFNPVDAGNVRLKGLYIDVVDKIPTRLVDGNTIRVGIAAQRYPFPAPTGLVDFDINEPSDYASQSLQVDNGSNNSTGLGGNLEASLPMVDHTAALFLGVAMRNARRPEGGTHKARGLAASFLLHPNPDAEVLLFGGANLTRSEEARATLFPAGATLPPEIPRGEFLGQPWTGRNSDVTLFGATTKWKLGSLRLEAGLFNSARIYPQNFSDSLIGVRADGSTSNRIIVATAGNRDKALSGEIRLVRDWASGPLAQSVILSVRGRNKDRWFGGGQRIALGPSSAIAADFRPAPAIQMGPMDHDVVRQRTFGIAYSGALRRRMGLDFSLSKTSYSKSVDFAAPTVPDVITKDRPMVGNVSLWALPIKGLALFGGYSRGQEEALIAPDVATNRSEAPPAIRTTQVETGARIALGSQLTMITTVFSITKPYYNLDPSLRYRQLGTLTNRGLELSLTGQITQGLKAVVGTLLLDSRISREAGVLDNIGTRPVGQARRRSVLNVDWRMQNGKGPLSLDLSLESLSSKTANTANTLFAPARNTFNFGARYRFAVRDVKMVARMQVQNAFNAYGWNVSTSGGFTYTNPRYLFAQLVADF
jgi:iron complex outermembrane receptor protein